MATVRIPDHDETLTDPAAIKARLAQIGIGYERWKTDEQDLSADVPAETILNAYAAEIEELKASGGYVTADVIDVKPDTPNLDAMLAKFSREHWHDEDEVRFIIEGRGLFHIRPKDGSPVVGIEMETGDLIRVPAGTWHWFDLCAEGPEGRRVRAIRLFQDVTGWTPHYTDTGAEQGYMPVCFGFKFIPAQLQKL